jgi:hypothetical protein
MVSCSEGGRPHARAGTVNRRIATNRMNLMSSLRDFPFMRFYHERIMPRMVREENFIKNKRLAETRGTGETKFWQEIGI